MTTTYADWARARACAGKVRYPKRALAKRSAKLAARIGQRDRMNVYRCEFCSQWHIACQQSTGLRRWDG